ncbi:MAG TPA: hypothetical protein VNN17_07045 [Terriglobia bacterium]|nr:hypothetical protein [Terriglobia bacterium]
MKVLLVNDQGQLLASMENLEQYDRGNPGDLFALLDFVERWIAAARECGDHQTSAA